jgi:ATP synthase I chain
VHSGTVQTTQGMALELQRAEGRLPRWMIGLGAAGSVATGILEGMRFGAGFALGAALAVLNYFWLHQAIEALFSAGQSRVPGRVVAKFALRYPLAIAGLYLVYKTGWVPFIAILAGLFVPVAAVLMEAVVQLSTGWRLTTDD